MIKLKKMPELPTFSLTIAFRKLFPRAEWPSNATAKRQGTAQQNKCRQQAATARQWHGEQYVSDILPATITFNS